MNEGGKVDEFKEVLAVVSEKIPALLNSITDVLYGKASSEKYGQAIANFYKTLKESGMSDEQAFKLTEQYMSSLSLGKIFEQAIGSRGHEGSPEHWKDIGEEIKRKVEAARKGKGDED